MSHCVVLGDVVGSRQIEDREAFHAELRTAIAMINDRHEDALVAPFETIKGVDELGGVLASVTPLSTVQKRLSRAVHPEQIRLAAVVGEVDVNPSGGDVAAMDGPAFAEADSVLDDLDEEGLTFRLAGIDPVLDPLISDQCNLLDMVRSQWSERKLEVIVAYEEHGTQREAAASLDISTQAVSEHLRGANWHQIDRIESRLATALGSYPSLTDRGEDNERRPG